MARLLKQSEAKKLGLPGRTSLEPVSGEIGSRVSFRIAEVAVPKPGDKPRGPHRHNGFEECIYVLRGSGVNHSESAEASRLCSCASSRYRMSAPGPRNLQASRREAG